MSRLTPATGLIIAASVLVAAGLAVYESQQVQEWFDTTRRKVVQAFQPRSGEKDELHREEDDLTAAVAVEAARRKRDELMARNQLELMQRHSKRRPSKRASANFDDFLQGDGEGAYTLQNTAVETKADTDGLRRRRGSTYGEPTGAAEGNPFINGRATQVVFDRDDSTAPLAVPEKERMSRESSATLAEEPSAVPPVLTPITPLIDTSPQDRNEPLIDITPTASTPTTSPPVGQQSQTSSNSYFPIDAWTGQANPSFYSATSNVHSPLSEEQWHRSATPSVTGSGVDVAEEMSEGEDVVAGRHLDIISDDGGMTTPGSWTEVGSEISEGDFGGSGHSEER
ncbi:MAG: hypothetical protein M1833_000504 [Piccolia ochrophora]|nr:MAG: hypothetical protein M1833_000504 [Piccolia ochrophora]